jgi:hypothetical protein
MTTRGSSGWLAIAAVAWLATSCGRGNMREDKDSPSSPLELVVRAPASAAVGRPVSIEVSLRNVSTSPVLVNGRMLVDEARGLPGRHELEPVVLDPGGAPLPFMQDVDAPEATAADLVVLGPGQAVTRPVALERYFRFARPGAYKLELVYRNDRALERDGGRAFVGRVSAAPLAIDVAP